MLHENSSPQALGFVRIGVYSIWLSVLLWTPVTTLADFPAEWFEPLGVYVLVPKSFYPLLTRPAMLMTLQVISIALTTMAILGLRPFAPIAVLTVITAILHDTLFKGFSGFVNHAQIGTILAMCVLAIFPAADAMSVLGPPRKPARPILYSSPLIILAALLALPYAAIGSFRIANGAPSIFFNDTIISYIGMRSLDTSSFQFRVGLAAMESPQFRLVLKIGFFVTTIFELLTPLCLLSNRFRRIWLIVIVPFHFTTMLTMNILFWENVLLIFLVFTNAPHFFAIRNRSPDGLPVLFYDGQCGLCNGFVHFLMKRDTHDIFRYAPLQGETAHARLPDLPADTGQWSVIFQDESGLHERSSAALRAIARIGGLWTLTKILLLIPRFLRDTVYNLVARNRYRFIPRLEACPIPTPEERARMLP